MTEKDTDKMLKNLFYSVLNGARLKKMPQSILQNQGIWGGHFLSRHAIRCKHAQKPLWGVVEAFAVGLAVLVRAFRYYRWRGAA